MSADPSSPDAASADELAREVAELKIELWAARDAAIGATKQAGTLRARNKELEAMIGALRVEVDRLAHVEQSKTYRLGSMILQPFKAARQLMR